MIAQERDLAVLANECQTGVRIGAVTYNIAQAQDSVDALPLDVLEYGRQRLKIPVDV